MLTLILLGFGLFLETSTIKKSSQATVVCVLFFLGFIEYIIVIEKAITHVLHENVCCPIDFECVGT